MAVLLRRYAKATEDFHRKFTLPYEDRIKGAATKKWPGGYRWFRSPNVKPIEHYRRASIQATTTKRAG
jgi:hypothetical protein